MKKDLPKIKGQKENKNKGDIKMKKNVLSLVLLATILAMSIAISSVRAGNWVEVTRWSDSGFPDPKQFTTEHFNCSHVEWRIRWSYIAVGSPFESVLVIKIYEEGESEYIGLIYKEGYISKSGVKSIHNNSGTFCLGITFANMDECTIIVEQDTDSVPEFTSTALIIGLITVSALAVVLSKKKLFVREKEGQKENKNKRRNKNE